MRRAILSVLAVVLLLATGCEQPGSTRSAASSSPHMPAGYGVLVGGIIPDQDIGGLKKAGVAAIFQPGTAMDDIVKFIRTHVKGPGVATA